MAAGMASMHVTLCHKYAEDVPVELKIEMGGTEDQRLLVARLHRKSEVPAMMAFDRHLGLVFANMSMGALLGHKVAAMKGMELAKFMPQPFGYLHQRWIKVRVGCVLCSPDCPVS